MNHPWAVHVLTIAFIFLPTCPALAAHDNSVRTDLNFKYQHNEIFRTVSYVFFQWNEDVSNYNYTEQALGLLAQTPISWLSFLLYYQQAYSEDSSGEWLLEVKPSLNLNTTFFFHRARISNQIRYEYRFTPEWDDYRIKNTMGISWPRVFLRPAALWELFYEHHDHGVVLHRFKISIDKKINDNYSLGPFYRLDFSRTDSHWALSRQCFGFQVTINY